MTAISQSFKLLLCGFALLCLAACDNLMGEDLSQEIQIGTRLIMKTQNGILEAELIKSSDGFRKWSININNRMAFVYKSYRGLLNVSVEEDGYQYWNEYDMARFDQLFPLEVGKEVSFDGTRHMRQGESRIPFWTHIAVREKTMMRVGQEDFEVFVLDIISEMKTDEGPVRETRTAWYSPKLGMDLKTEGRRGGLPYSNKIIRIELADEKTHADRRRNRGVGTVRI